jgi:molecular chaperone DnaK (HSP70)
MARYLVGIDLGTTHTVVAYADLHASSQPQLFEIEQLVAPGEVAARSMLPSLRYHPAPGELAEHDILLPWSGQASHANAYGILGELARELGSHAPGRLVTSAKSWLSHPSVDRAESILPWGSHEDVFRISPLEASASYLAHVRSAWDFRFAKDPLSNQEIILTVPASFDEGARALTLQAAHLAGLAGVWLIEEPLAASYDWLARNQDKLGSLLEGIRLLLVCDVGGGTTDFTLIKVESGDGSPRLTRIAVGDHLMLGGDNMDLALAHVAESRIVCSGAKLTAASLSQLVQQCRLAKERLLAPDAPERATVTLVGSGSKLIAGARSAELTRSEVAQMLVEGFFPHTAPDEKPQRVRSAIVEFGLPYVADPAVTRHISAFLARYADAAREALADESQYPIPNAVLMNGGVFRSETLARRLLETLQDWAGRPVHRLENESPDLSVARGAVAYGLSRRGRGIRIGAGVARNYFLILDPDKGNQKNGICILPRGVEEGKEVQLKDRIFSLKLGQPVQFHLVSSTGDASFQPGDLTEITKESFTPLPPIAAILPQETGVEEQRVHLAAVLTELGALQMSCLAENQPERRWNLEFQLRGAGASAQGIAGKLHPRFADAAEMIERIYGARRKEVDARQVRGIRRDLEFLLGERDQWDTALLRELFSLLWEGVRHRRRSDDHERIWFNLTGFCMRPGFGFPLDDWRMQQLWSVYEQGVQYAREEPVWSEWWTLWRRVAGGLDRKAQETILSEITMELLPPAKQASKRQNLKKQGHDNLVRLVGALERIHFEHKMEIGEFLLERLKSQTESIQTWWAIGRLGARAPFYGVTNNVIPRDVAAKWLEQAMKADWRAVAPAAFAAALLARVCGDRERDLDEDLRVRVADRLRAAGASPNWILMVEQITELNEADEKQVFGESLPPGLRLIH